MGKTVTHGAAIIHSFKRYKSEWQSNRKPRTPAYRRANLVLAGRQHLQEFHGRVGTEVEVFSLQGQKKSAALQSLAYAGAAGTEAKSCSSWTRRTLMDIWH